MTHRARTIADEALALWDEASAAWRAQQLETATVHLFCAPEDLDRVQAWVARQPSADLYDVRANPFVPAGRAYAFQLDGILAPSSLSCVMRA